MDKIYYYLSAGITAAFVIIFFITRNNTVNSGKAASIQGTLAPAIVQSPTILAKYNQPNQAYISGYSSSPVSINKSPQTFIVPNIYTPGYDTMPFSEPTNTGGISGYSNETNVIQLPSVPQTDGYNTFPIGFQPPVGQSIEPPAEIQVLEPVITEDPVVQPTAPEMQMPI